MSEDVWRLFEAFTFVSCVSLAASKTSLKVEIGNTFTPLVMSRHRYEGGWCWKSPILWAALSGVRFPNSCDCNSMRPCLIYQAQALPCNAKISFSVSRWPSGAKQLIHLPGKAAVNTLILGKVGHSHGKGEKDVKGPHSTICGLCREWYRIVPIAAQIWRDFASLSKTHCCDFLTTVDQVWPSLDRPLESTADRVGMNRA